MKETTLKTISKCGAYPDNYFLGRYAFSPYRACAHGCAYCDGRAERYYVEGDFAKDIEVRTNTPQLLSDFLGKIKEKGHLRIGSGVSDCYQPLEEDYQLMSQIADVCLQHSMPVSVLTKSSLVMRDLAKWKALHEKTGFILLMSIASTDDRVSEVWEPGASPISERIETLKAFKAEGIPVGALAMPVLPGISDSPAQLEDLYKLFADIGVDAVMPGGLTLRSGRQKTHYYDLLRKERPNLIPLYDRLYRGNRPSGEPEPGAMEDVMARMHQLGNKYKLPGRMPHGVWKNNYHLYDELYILLTNMRLLFYGHGSEKRLKEATKRYSQWLKEEKTDFYRKRSRNGDTLETKLRMMMATGEFDQIIGNEKLAAFLKEVAGGTVFDYRTLKLIKK